MSLQSGSKLGPYEIVSPLGAGGMGEVYRARDTKLRRDVALKVLPEAFSKDEQRMARFEREAQLLASLNHPHIAAIYGVEESSGTRALVMELVEGPTLAECIARGALPLEEALPIARQIAEALENAHEKGIIHRDLKPANIKITPDGVVKVLDFGLAKALQDEPASADLATSPTLSIAGTRAGIILGTASYMSPEQAAGKGADKRCDIWSFGVVLWEMLTGKQLFTGETISHVLAEVLKSDPDWNRLPASAPPAIRRLLARCLTRNVKERLRDIGEARITIEKVLSGTVEEAAASVVSAVAPSASWLRMLPWAGMALLAGVAILALWRPWQTPQSPGVLRFSAEFGGEGSLFVDYGPAAILSPDGTRMAFVVIDAAQKRHLYVRALDQLQAAVLPATDNARDPFFSPDGQWIGFFADNKLKKISVQGGAAVTLCEALDDRGAAWGEDGTILFTPTARSSLFSVSSAGGKPASFSTLDAQAGEITHRWPQFLPGGKAALFTSSNNGNNYEDADIFVQVIATGQRKKLFHGGYHARYLPGGHLVFVHEGTLFAATFDLQRLKLSGQPVPVLEGVAANPNTGGAQFFSVQSGAQAGMFAYLAGKSGGQDLVIDWVTRDGKLTPLRETPAVYLGPAFSPDGSYLATEVDDGKRQDIWVDDWQRDTVRRLTFGNRVNHSLAWTPDGKRISYASDGLDGNYSIEWTRADGAGDALRLVDGNKRQLSQMSWHPSGKIMAFTQLNPATGPDIMTLTLDGDEKSGWKPGAIKPFLNTPYREVWPMFSPDGRWLAYSSDESGSFEIFVCPFPGPGGKWQISSGGGTHAQWALKGGEMFFVNGDGTLMTVRYTAKGDSFQPGTPEVWTATKPIDLGAFGPYAVHPGGKRLVVIEPSAAATQAPINKVGFILNFPEELRRKLAAGREKPAP